MIHEWEKYNGSATRCMHCGMIRITLSQERMKALYLKSEIMWSKNEAEWLNFVFRVQEMISCDSNRMMQVLK